MGGQDEHDVQLDEMIFDCPYCNHAWKVNLNWIQGLCPKCSMPVYRFMMPEHD